MKLLIRNTGLISSKTEILTCVLILFCLANIGQTLGVSNIKKIRTRCGHLKKSIDQNINRLHGRHELFNVTIY